MAISLFVISAIFRFGIPTEPRDKLIFDENYFVLQTESYMVNKYFYDPHGIIGRIPLYIGHMLANPDFVDKIDMSKLADKSEDGYQVTLNLDGIRAAPKLFGSILAVLIFIICFQLINWKNSKPQSIAGYLIPYMGGLLIAFENSLILDSRIAMLSEPMFVFMALAIAVGISYFKSKGRKRTAFWFLAVVLSVGLVLGTKMVAYSVLPFVLVLVWLKEYLNVKPTKLVVRVIGATVISLIVVYIAFVFYLSTFIWHFNQFKYTSDSASGALDSYEEDLKNGTNETTFLAKYWDWQKRSFEYQQLVPKLDYTKSDEIGSMWITWPMMARPINYWNEYVSDNGQNFFVGLITIGNPVVWFGGLAGVLLLLSMGIGRLFVGRNGFGWKHLFVLGLFFANWLPFALIDRVMYIYHYYPALIFSAIAWALLVHDFIIPRLVTLSARLQAKYQTVIKLNMVQRFFENKAEWITIGIFIGMLLITTIGFYLYAPFTYKLPINKSTFEQRIFIKEWNVKWKGAN